MGMELTFAWRFLADCIPKRREAVSK